jgi:hypothetical protein
MRTPSRSRNATSAGARSAPPTGSARSRAARLRRDHVEDQREEDRAGERGRRERHHHRAPVAERLDELLRGDDQGAPHARNPSPLPSSATNASSSVAAPDAR